LTVLTLILLGLSGVAFVLGVGVLLRGAQYRPTRPLTLVVARRIDHTDDLFTLRLRRIGVGRLFPLPPFAAGQSVAVSLPDSALKRRYSLARWKSMPFSYELTIKREPEGRLSPRLHAHARPGATLHVSRPDGHFVLPEHRSNSRAVFIAGGVGITPLLAMLDQWSRKRHSYPEVYLYWQVRHEPEALYREELDVLAHRHPNLHVRLLVSKPTEGTGTRISVALLEAELGSMSNTDFFLCAGSRLLDSMLDGLSGSGVEDRSLHYERFSLGTANAPDEGWSVACGGVSFPFRGYPTLLDALEDQGFSLDSDCRTGTCGRCLLVVENGEAQHRIRPEGTVPSRHVLACCAIPKSDLQIRIPGQAAVPSPQVQQLAFLDPSLDLAAPREDAHAPRS
jgi:ferredoxin-NADP reductase